MRTPSSGPHTGHLRQEKPRLGILQENSTSFLDFRGAIDVVFHPRRDSRLWVVRVDFVLTHLPGLPRWDSHLMDLDSVNVILFLTETTNYQGRRP